MRRLVVATALCFSAMAGGVAGAGLVNATEPTADDWSVRRTYVSTAAADVGQMYVDWTVGGRPLASAGGCTPAATDDSCA